jgi:hypothetical protein
LSESSLYKELGILTKKKDQWEENIPYISSLLSHDSVKIQAKALNEFIITFQFVGAPDGKKTRNIYFEIYDYGTTMAGGGS